MAAALACLVAQQPVQLRLPRPHPDDVLGGADLGDDRDRLLVVLARGGELAAHGDPVRQLGQGERDPEPLAQRPELGERRLAGTRPRSRPPWPSMIRILPSVQPGQRAHPGILGRLSSGSNAVRNASGACSMRSSAATTPSAGWRSWLRWL